MTPRAAASQAPPSTGFSRQEHWSGLPFPSLGDLPDPGIEPASPAMTGGFFTNEPPGKPAPHIQWNAFLRLKEGDSNMMCVPEPQPASVFTKNTV